MSWDEVLKVAATMLVSLGGGSIVVFALSGFLARVAMAGYQGGIDARLKKLEAALTHRTYLRQRFAELELQAISECWRAARPCLPLLYVARSEDSGTDEDVLAVRKRLLSKAHDRAIAALHRNEPFLPGNMLALLDGIGQVVRLELSHIRHHKHFDSTWWDDGKRNHQTLKSLTDTLLLDVKARLAELRAEADAEEGGKA